MRSAESDPLAELENVFASLRARPEIKPVVIPPSPPPAPSPATVATPAAPAPQPIATPAPPTPKPFSEAGSWSPKPSPAAAPTSVPPRAEPFSVRSEKPAPQSWTPPSFSSRPEPAASDIAAELDASALEDDLSGDDVYGADVDAEAPPRDAPRRTGRPAIFRGNFAVPIAAAVALLFVVGGGYAVWLNSDAFGDLFGPEESEIAATDPAATAPAEAPPAAAPEPAAAAPEPAEPAPAAEDQAAAETPEVQKFTQRLNEDGTETDEGPAGGTAPQVGEGTTVAALTQPPTEAPAGEQPATTGIAAATPPAPAQAPAGASVAVGQKAIFYEERTSTAQGSAESGSVVWSVVQESPGGDAPPEPAIRGDAVVPGKDLRLRMTIRRNADETLPASHIIELIFLTPENFGGGGIDSILRFALKDTEEAPGSPLIGIPAKIADGYFLVALNDSKAEIDANTRLLRGQNWIDIPVTYKSGRRALITMEKGIPGEKAFDEAMKAWQVAGAG
jgi:hypothetical protein